MAFEQQHRSPQARDPGADGGRTPPASLEAERALLGALLLDPGTLNTVLEHVKEEDFYRESHRHIFGAICALFERNEPFDPIALSDELRRAGTFDSIGGTAYISALLDAVPAMSSIEHYARMVAEKATSRRMIWAASEIVSIGYDAELAPRDYLDRAQKLVFEVLDAGSRSEAVPLKHVLKEAISHIQALYEKREGVTGLTTGFEKLDSLLLGLHPTDLIILAARPAMGKTTFVLNLAANAALLGNAAVVVFSLEMGSEQLALRMLSSESRIELGKLRSGFLSDADWPRLANAAARLAEARIFIDESGSPTVLDIRAKTRRLRLEGKCDLIVIDYLQLMQGRNNTASREQVISEISRSLKGLAKELNVPIIALSQLNRGLEQRTDKRPMMSDLRESGAIEQDADIIGFIYRDEVYHPETEDKGIGEIIIAKHRNGPTGTVKLKFFNTFTRFDNLYEDVPR